MATLDVPNRYLALAPVIITSPTGRCGTTLLQRLLSSADNGYIYGEEVGHQIRTVLVWLIGMLRQLEDTEHATDADFERSLAGTLRDWRPGLTAPTAVMRKAWVETFYQLPAALADYSREIERPIWGFKVPGYSRDMLRSLVSMMPKTRVVYVFRNLVDVLKSAKARKFTQTEDQTTLFCSEWAKNLREAAELARDERVLFVKYEDLLLRPSEHIQLLQMFTGAKNISPKGFDLKINTYEGDPSDGHSPSQYIDPAELTDAERATIQAEAGLVMDHFYPGWAERSGRIGGELQASQAGV